MLDGKTAIVTGAAGDLGSAMARQLAEYGGRVACNTFWKISSIRPASGSISAKRSQK